MYNTIYLYKIICPECGAIHHGFIGDNEDGDFYCDTLIEVKKGKKMKIKECGYSIEKIRHLPEENCENIAIIKLKDSKPYIEYIKQQET